MRSWDARRVAAAAGARLAGALSDLAGQAGPRRVTIDSRSAGPEDLFVGLPGRNTDGGEYAADALRAGAWGVLVTPEHARAAVRSVASEGDLGGVVLAHPDPLRALQTLARAWRRELKAGGTRVVAVTGSTGKTSTKDILVGVLGARSRVADSAAKAADRLLAPLAGEPAAPVRTVASTGNLNTEIGLPLAVLAAPSDTEVLVLELAMRGAGQIAELTAIAEPDVGVIVNVGPVHLELLGSLEAIASAKAELIAGLAPGATLVIPADEPLLRPHLREELRTVTFGSGGDVALEAWRPGAAATPGGSVGAAGAVVPSSGGEVVIRERDRAGPTPKGGVLEGSGSGGELRIVLQPSFGAAHNVQNLLAAVAAARALGATPHGRVDVQFGARRGERVALEGGVTLIDDCYNANPMSMRAAIDDLAETAPARRVAVLGDMLELGPAARSFHREIGAYAAARGVDVLVTVGPLAAEMRATFTGEGHSVPHAEAAVGVLAGLLREGDTVLVKASRGVGLERVVETLATGPEQAHEQAPDAPTAAPFAGPRRR